MKRAFLRALVGQRATIKQRWRSFLQNAPTHTPLANPDLLAYLIDDTLGDLLCSALFPKGATIRSGDTITAEFARAGSGCGLNPYIGYFLAGEAALVSVIRNIAPTSQLSENEILHAEAELLFTFRVMSHREVNAFCEICRIERPASLPGHRRTLPENCPFKGLAAAGAAPSAHS